MLYFQKRRFKVLVTTDLASSGIHLRDVAHVINYDPPTPEDLYSPCRRSGRAEARGLASTLASGARVSELRRIERALRLRIERKKIEYNHLVRQWRCRETIFLPER